MLKVCLLLLITILSFAYCDTIVRAGAGRVNASLPLGVPLSGYNHGDRTVPEWPVPEFKKYTTFMTGATGYMDDGIWIRAVIVQVAATKICIVTFDGIGADQVINKLAYTLAKGRGFSVPFENVMFSSSHTHSGPGAVGTALLWSLAPATDLFVPQIHRQLANAFADAMMEAQNTMQAATIGIGGTELIGVTRNRRAKISPYVDEGTIDPHLGVLRVDDIDGKPIATVWNFAIHGTCWGASNMLYSGDIMGGANKLIEAEIGGYALFINGDAGDVAPASGMCNNKPDYFGAHNMSDAVVGARKNTTTFNGKNDDVILQAASLVDDFGPATVNFTLARFFDCKVGGPLEICTICRLLKCELNPPLPSSWIENSPRFTAFRFNLGGEETSFVTLPGEAIVELGWQVRNDSKDLGFGRTFVCGYSNAHLGYFTTPNEYDIGGYESILTLWGIKTSSLVRNGALKAMQLVRPTNFKVSKYNENRFNRIHSETEQYLQQYKQFIKSLPLSQPQIDNDALPFLN